MDKREPVTGKSNQVWGEIWREVNTDDAHIIFKHRLLVEGAPIFGRHFPSAPQTILDIGSGNGRYTFHWARQFPAATVTAVDISPASVALINQFAITLGITNCTAITADVNHLPFADGSFDVVFCDVVIQHMEEVGQALAEMKRVLKTEGWLIIAVNNVWSFHTLYKLTLRLLGRAYSYGYEKSYTKRELRQLLTAAGFQVMAEDGFYPAYGLYRLKIVHPWFGFLGRLVNRLTKLGDKFSGRFFSRYFGMEILVVARKSSK
ncbi:MAG: class I SAM-dependent methyltransferase [Patescibacteria group bacterium]